MTVLNKKALREAAQEEIMLRSVSDTSDAWQDEASPEAVMALLDELEAEQRICSTWRKTYEANSEKLEAAEKLIAEQREYYEGVIADGSRRIAELDSRTVTLPPKEHDNGTDSQIDINAGFANRMWQKCYDAIRAAGISVKGE